MKTKFTVNNLPISVEVLITNFDIKILESVIHKRLNELFSLDEIKEIHKSLNIDVTLCNMCKEDFVPFHYILEITDNLVSLVGANCNIKPNIYCYGKNINCKERTRRGKMNPNSAEFISIVRGITIDEAKVWIRQNNKSTFYKENYSSLNDYKKAQARDLNWHIKKYGDELGAQKYKEVIEKQNYARSKSGFIEKYGDELGKQKYKKYCKEKDSMTLKSFERMYPNLTKVERKELCKKRRKSVGLTREEFIEKHGAQRFHDIQKKRQARAYHGVSRWSLDLISKIIDFLDDAKIENINEIKFGECNEHVIYDNDNKRSYAYDFYIEIGNRRKIVEFNGRAFHAPPNLTQQQKEAWTGVYSKRTWQESFDHDTRKTKIANNAGIEVLSVWDFESQTTIIKKVKKFLNG